MVLWGDSDYAAARSSSFCHVFALVSLTVEPGTTNHVCKKRLPGEHHWAFTSTARLQDSLSLTLNRNPSKPSSTALSQISAVPDFCSRVFLTLLSRACRALAVTNHGPTILRRAAQGRECLCGGLVWSSEREDSERTMDICCLSWL